MHWFDLLWICWKLSICCDCCCLTCEFLANGAWAISSASCRPREGVGYTDDEGGLGVASARGRLGDRSLINCRSTGLLSTWIWPTHWRLHLQYKAAGAAGLARGRRGSPYISTNYFSIMGRRESCIVNAALMCLPFTIYGAFWCDC